MSRGDASDDFFGIVYESSSNNAKTEVDPVIESRASAQPTSSSRHVARKQSGTEFLDESFFPGLKEREPHDHGRSEGERRDVIDGDDANVFDRQYFVRSQPAANRSEPEPATSSWRDMQRAMTSNDRRDERPENERRPRKEKRRRDGDDEKRFRHVAQDEDSDSPNGLEQLRSRFVPVWKMSDAELTELMAQRMVHCDANLVAFDKPFSLPYSGGPAHRPQLDRILQAVKMRVTPKVERLHLVKSVDKQQSGLVIFATNKLLQTELMEMNTNGLVDSVHRCLVRGGFPDSEFDVTIPLVKTVSQGNMKLLPLLSNQTKQPISYVESHVKTIAGTELVSYVEVTAKKEVAHQVRAHLSMSGCPLIGDEKYGNNQGRPPRMSNRVLALLDVSENQAKKISMYSHLKEVRLPSISGAPPVTLRAPMPDHFMWILKRLRLLKR